MKGFKKSLALMFAVTCCITMLAFPVNAFASGISRTVSTFQELQEAVMDSSVSTINISNNITMTSQLTVNRSLTIQSYGTTRTLSMSSYGYHFLINASNITFSATNITLDATSGGQGGIGLQSASGVNIHGWNIQNTAYGVVGTDASFTATYVTVANVTNHYGISTQSTQRQTLSVQYCDISFCKTGVLATNASSLYISNTPIRECTTAIQDTDTLNVSIYSCDIRNNTEGYKSGPNCTQRTIDRNTFYDDGCAIYIQNSTGTTNTITNNNFYSCNLASADQLSENAAVVYMNGGGSTTFNNNLIDTGLGRGILAHASTADMTLNMQDSTIQGRTSNIGAGLYLNSSSGKTITANITNGTFKNNTTQYKSLPANGAAIATGIFGNHAVLNIHGGLLEGNNAQNSGGAIFASSADVLIDDGCIIRSNTAISGGGIYVGTGDVQIDDATIEKNEADNGGGIYVSGAGPYTVVLTLSAETTITDNTATSSGGGIYSSYKNIYVTNGANISGNHAPRNPDV